jgi:hypothetical protein
MTEGRVKQQIITIFILLPKFADVQEKVCFQEYFISYRTISPILPVSSDQSNWRY